MKAGIVLIGMAGCGKSTLGPLVAKELGFEFVDLDQCIRQSKGCTIQEIIDTQGEDELLRLEEESLSSIDPAGKVIAPGGSVVYIPSLMERLQEICWLIFVDERYERIARRLRNARSRGIVGLKTRSLRQIFAERRPLYLKYADLSIRPAGRSRQNTAAAIAAVCRRLIE